MVSIGSCFSENIGKKLKERQFRILINPFGQQYNPYSVARAMERMLDPVPYSESDLVYHHELFHSFDHHGDFSKPTSEETLSLINLNLKEAADAMRRADILFLTFGTAHYFRLKDSVRIVSNCHKLSGSLFERGLLNPDDIRMMLQKVLDDLRKINPGVRVIFTVSPVRYFAFGHYENSVSKAHLFTAIHALQQARPEYYYFPAYELVMDDLRDYRFFAEDMLHPNYEATNYVWQSFSSTLMSVDTQELNQTVEEILRAVRHRPRNPASQAHRAFVQATLEKINILKSQHGVTMNEEADALSIYLK